jgi:hypothetical protein
MEHLCLYTTYMLVIKIIPFLCLFSRTAYSVDTCISNTRIADTRDILLAISFYFVITYSIH